MTLEQQEDPLQRGGPESAPEPPLTVWDALAWKYSLPHHVLLQEVRNSTGFDSTRSADAIAISLYVSRGHTLTGFEVKHSRSDWLTELKHPEKAEEIAKFCDFFFLVTANTEIAKLDELPGPWGWMVFTGKRLKVMKPAERLKVVPLDRAMLCSIVYKTMKRFKGEATLEIESQVRERVESEYRALTFRMKHAEERYDSLEKKVEEFEKASGVYIRYEETKIPKIGDAVRRILNGDGTMKEYKAELDHIYRRATGLAKRLEDELTSLKSEKDGNEE